MRRQRRKDREALATVELAICLPILLTLTLATVDICSAMFIKESVAVAAYEGARAGIERGGTDADAVARVKQILNERGISFNDGSVCTISPVSFDDADTLQHVQVTVTVPMNGNIISPAELFVGGNLTKSVWMRKEYANLD